MIVYIENPIDSTKKLLDLIHKFGKVVGYKSIFRNQRHFYIPTGKYQKQKLGGKIPFTVATRKLKYLGINLTKEVKYLYSENYRTLKKEIKEDTNKWKCIPCSWIARINIIKMFIYPNQSTDSTQSLYKYQ